MSRKFSLTKKTGFTAAAFCLCAAAAAAGCQTFEMDKVEPEAVAAEQHDTPIVGVMDKSFIMLVIDKSGSMLDGVVNPSGSCSAKGTELGYDRNGDCRWNSLLDAFAGKQDGTDKGFLRKSLDANDGQGSALFGLATYPTGNQCEAGSVSIKLSESNDNVEKIIERLNKIAPAGGTPTAPTLNALLNQDALLSTPSNVRKRFVMLLTDGAPNCNASPANAARCDACNQSGDSAACNDLTIDPIACYPVNTTPFGLANKCDQHYIGNPAMYGTDCLDKDSTVEAIQALRDVGVETFVIGFGNTGDSEALRMTLNQAAIAGGHPVGKEGDGIRFYEATDTDSLSAALEAILNATTGCSFPLSPKPRSCSEVEVKLRTVADNSVRSLIRDTEWTCTEDEESTVVEILDGSDAICSEKLMTSPANTYEIQFFYSVDL